MTKYAKEVEATTPDEDRVVTMDEARALPGLIGRIAPAMLARHGVYGYRVIAEGKPDRKIRVRLAK